MEAISFYPLLAQLRNKNRDDKTKGDKNPFSNQEDYIWIVATKSQKGPDIWKLNLIFYWTSSTWTSYNNGREIICMAII